MDIRIITGKIGKNAEVRETKNGKKYLAYSVANDDHTNANGEKQTIWHNCKQYVYGNGEKLVDYLKKGTYVTIEGLSEVSKNKDGDIIHYITVDKLSLQGGGQSEGNSKKQMTDDVKRAVKTLRDAGFEPDEDIDF